MRVLVINGPNLNLLGAREPDIYGSTTLSELEDEVRSWADDIGIEVDCFQSNHEGEIIDQLHAARRSHDGIIINAGALTHYSYSLHDAILATELPAVEVHISNIKTRESWRRHSVLTPACVYAIYGRGLDGYRHALDHLRHRSALPFSTVGYGASADQVADLRLPDGNGPHPVAILIHGGFWRDHWTRDSMDAAAVDLARRGWATWNLEYHRVGTGGGWPATLEDIDAGIDHLATVASDHPLDLDRVVAIGHSAGGQLALWATRRPRTADHVPDRTMRVHVQRVVALAPVSDLDSGFRDRVGRGAVEEFVRRTPQDGPDRYAVTSPARMLPLGVAQTIIHGTADDAVPVEMSRTYAEAATSAGDTLDYHELDGVGHMSLIDPSHPAWQAVVDALEG